ncbi:hypothetical protein ACETU7_35240 [Rhodococcus sp. 3Y1]
MGWAAGQLISTTSDLNQFLYALLDGRLLPAAELDQMRTTVHVGGPTDSSTASASPAGLSRAAGSTGAMAAT